MAARQPMSPVNIEQNREVGIDTPADGSRMGREADKPSGDPGERGHEAPAPRTGPARRPGENEASGGKA